MAKNLITKKSNQYLIINPCNSLGPCAENEDYDPCNSTEDITEKDLTILLKEDAAKLQSKHEANEEIAENAALDEKPNSDINENNFKPEEKRKKKKICKNIKAPIFSNPLNFSSCISPPPPAPPPQYFPLTETYSAEKISPQKEKKRKTCEKQKKLKYNEKKDEDERIRENIEDNNESIINHNNSIINTGVPAAVEDNYLINDDKGTEADVEDETDDDHNIALTKEDKKRKCKKRSERPLCKKISDISISLLPPQIPPLQRDMPQKSPKDIPEVNKQILMACGLKTKQKCKKKKEEIKKKNC